MRSTRVRCICRRISLIWVRRWVLRVFSTSHLAVFSVGIPTCSASTSAAVAEGASPIDRPGSVGVFPGGAEAGHGGRLAGPGRTDQHVQDPPGVDDLLDREPLLSRQLPTGPVPGRRVGGDRTGWSRGPSRLRPASRRRASASKSASVV